MSQYNFGDLSSPLTGTALVNTHLEPWRDALHSTHSGATPPSYIVAGMMWLDTATTPWILKVYDGADHITLGTINATTNVFVPAVPAANTITPSMLTAPASLNSGGTVGGTANAITLTPTPALGAYFASDMRTFLPSASNTSGTVTVAVSGLATRNIKKFIGGAVVLLAVGDLIVSEPAIIIDDGTQYILLNPKTYAQGADVASATTTNLDTTTGDYVHVTGTTTITAITLAQGRQCTVVFDGALILTNGASLLLEGGANITTAAGDTAVFRGEASGVVRCIKFQKKDGTATVSGGGASTLVLLATATASASANLSFTTGITSAYSQIIFVIESLLNATNTQTLICEVSTDAGSTWSTNVRSALSNINESASVTTATGTASVINLIPPSTARQNNGNEGANGQMIWGALGVATHHAYTSDLYYREESTLRTSCTSTGQHIEATAVNAVRFKYGSGNITSGKIYMYGVKNT